MSMVSGRSVERMVSGRSAATHRYLGGNVLDGKYQFEYDVGLWTYGRVQVLKHRLTDQRVVCKSVRKANIRDPSRVMPRLKALKDFGNDYVSKITDALEDQDMFYVISELCKGGDLAEWEQRVREQGNWFQEHTVAEYIRHVLIALHHCQGTGISHRDLRPSSLLLTTRMPDAKVKVADFGLADIFDPTGDVLRAGDSPFVAPEVLDPVRDAHGKVLPCSPAVDMWNVGAIAHQLLTGFPPPRQERQPHGAWAAITRVGSRAWDKALDIEPPECDDMHPLMQDRSSMSRDFVRRLLCFQANERPTPAAALQLQWMEACVTLNPAFWLGQEAFIDVKSRLTCYMLATLLMPVKMEYNDLFQLRSGFRSADSDQDGFLSIPRAHRLLKDRGAATWAAAAALDAVDVKGAGVVDLAAAAAAWVIACGGLWPPEVKVRPQSASDFVPMLLHGFFEAFGDVQRMVSNVPTVLERHTRSVAQQAETHLGISFEEMMACLDDEKDFDQQALVGAMLESRGRGTPLSTAEPSSGSDSDGDHDSTWGEALGLDRVNDLFKGVFATCGLQEGAGGHRQRGEPPLCDVTMRSPCFGSPTWSWSSSAGKSQDSKSSMRTPTVGLALGGQ